MRKTAVASFHEAGWGAGLGDPARALHGQDAWRQPVECLPEVVRRRVRRRKVKNLSVQVEPQNQLEDGDDAHEAVFQ